MLVAHPERRLHWALAFGGASLLHLVGFALVFDLLPSFRSAATPSAFDQIAIATVFVPEDQLAALIDPSDAPDSPTESQDDGAGQEAVPEPEPDPAPEPEPIAPSNPDVETLTAEAPDTETVQAQTETTLSPIVPEDGLVLQGAQTEVERIAAAAPETLRPELPDATPVAAPSAVPDPSPGPVVAPSPTSPEDLALMALIERIRQRLSDPCLVVIPQSQGPALPPLVQMIADQDVVMRRFETEVLSDPELEVEARATLIDRRQCPAVTFLRDRPEYPAFRLGMGVASRDVVSGETLVGSIDGVGGAYTSLLLIDDNGVVQDLRRFMRFTSGRAEFAVPVTRDGAARDTSQLLMAIATPDRPLTIGAQAGQLAEQFFAPLAGELGPSARVAILSFDVR